jgi:hypothetical protein
MNWKEYGKKRSWINLSYGPGIYLEVLMKTTKFTVTLVSAPAEI